jgi:SNF2 family DNA or RNA helicase
MIIIPKKRALVLKLRDPLRVTAIIPTAKVIELDGQQYVAVPHKLEEVKVLRNLGLAAPSPIRHYYPYPNGLQLTPFEAQYGTSEFLTLIRNGFVLNDLGTGKTLSVLWAYDYLRQIGEVHKMFVCAPLSTLERVWADEIFTNFPHLKYSVLYGSREKRLKLLDQEADIYIINHDGIKVKGFLEAMAVRDDIDVVVPDEGAQIARNSGADRWKVLNKICNKQTPRRVWWLTGTPTPNAPTDAWAQCRIVVPNSVPNYFNRFKDQVMQQKGPFTWIPRATATDTVFSVMQPAVRFTRDACVDLPPCMYQTRTVEFSPEQKKAYKEMLNKLRAELEAGEITAVNEAVKASKLLQIACGAVYGPNREVIDIPSTERIQVVREIIEAAAGKVIVFVPYVGALEKIAHELAYLLAQSDDERAVLDSGGDLGHVAVIHGGVPNAQRSEIFRKFQKEEYPRVLVAQPAAMSHGLTLTEANTIVWYSAIGSNETYEQANGRITRPGQKQAQFIINIEGCPAERKAYDRLKKRQSMQNLLLELVETQADVVHL